ncbi:hypothetical protein V6Z12_A10G184000 [Gossypium hirsutum]
MWCNVVQLQGRCYELFSLLRSFILAYSPLIPAIWTAAVVDYQKALIFC